MFLLSGLLSLVFIALFLLLIWRLSGRKFKDNKNILFASIAGIFILVNIFYFTDLIPPIPLYRLKMPASIILSKETAKAIMLR